MTEKNRSWRSWCASDAACKGYQPIPRCTTCQPKAGAEDLELMAGNRPTVPEDTFLRIQKDDCLAREIELDGRSVNRKRVRRLMQLIGAGGHLPASQHQFREPNRQGISRSIRTCSRRAGDQPGYTPACGRTDITYIPMARGFLRDTWCAIMDWHSRLAGAGLAAVRNQPPNGGRLPVLRLWN